MIKFESGDVIVMDTSGQAKVEHAVEGIVLGTCPEKLPSELHNARLSLQFRDQIISMQVSQQNWTQKQRAICNATYTSLQKGRIHWLLAPCK